MKTQCLRSDDDVLVATLNEAILFVRAWRRNLDRYPQVVAEIVKVVAKFLLSIGMDNNDIELEHTLDTTDKCSKLAHYGWLGLIRKCLKLVPFAEFVDSMEAILIFILAFPFLATFDNVDKVDSNLVEQAGSLGVEKTAQNDLCHLGLNISVAKAVGEVARDEADSLGVGRQVLHSFFGQVSPDSVSIHFRDDAVGLGSVGFLKGCTKAAKLMV